MDKKRGGEGRALHLLHVQTHSISHMKKKGRGGEKKRTQPIMGEDREKGKGRG